MSCMRFVYILCVSFFCVYKECYYSKIISKLFVAGLTLKTELKEQTITEKEFDTLPTQYTTGMLYTLLLQE